MKRAGKEIILRCLMLGILKAAYDIMYLYGIKYFDVSTGAFTFSITVVVLPVILLTMRKNVGKKTLISVAFVVSGIVIALGSTITGTQLPGLLLMIFGCTIRAIFIVKLNDFAKKYDSITLSVWISVVGAVISFIIWIIIQPSTFAAIPWSGTIIASLFIYAYFIVAFAQTLNIFAQKRATAAEATIIYSLEIVFSLICGAVLPETLIERVIPSPFHIIGAVLIIVGNLVEIIDFSKFRRVKNVSE